VIGATLLSLLFRGSLCTPAFSLVAAFVVASFRFGLASGGVFNNAGVLPLRLCGLCG
jgi:hypothetical protein